VLESIAAKGACQYEDPTDCDNGDDCDGGEGCYGCCGLAAEMVELIDAAAVALRELAAESAAELDPYADRRTIGHGVESVELS
jgi:hypothetical protein